jgi:hypothetical protein
MRDQQHGLDLAGEEPIFHQAVNWHTPRKTGVQVGPVYVGVISVWSIEQIQILRQAKQAADQNR